MRGFLSGLQGYPQNQVPELLLPRKNLVSPSRVRTVREVLTGNRTYFVRTDGNDSNTGLEDTSGGAFLTIQKGIDVASSLDISIYDVTIQIQNATRTLTSSIILKDPVGAGTVFLRGDTTTPANNILQSSTNNLWLIDTRATVRYQIEGFLLQASGGATGIRGINVGSQGNVRLGNNTYGTMASGTHIFINGLGFVQTVSPYSITGGGARHIQAIGNILSNQAITLTGTPNFTTAFIGCATGFADFIAGTSFTGSATGQQYVAFLTGVINTVAAFPGSTGGSVATNGVYSGP